MQTIEQLENSKTELELVEEFRGMVRKWLEKNPDAIKTIFDTESDGYRSEWGYC